MTKSYQLAITAMAAALAGCTQQIPKSAPGNLPDGATPAVAPKMHATTYFAHAHLLERQGNLDRAVEQYRLALEAQPDFLTARNRLGITLNKLGKHEEASNEFRKALLIKPERAFVLNNLGFSLYLEGRYAEAEQVLRRAIEQEPDFRRARMNLAIVTAKQGRFQESFDELVKACGESDAHYNLGLMQTEAAMYADAAASFDAALRLNPKLEAARQQLREVARLAATQSEGDSWNATPVNPAHGDHFASEDGQTTQTWANQGSSQSDGFTGNTAVATPDDNTASGSSTGSTSSTGWNSITNTTSGAGGTSGQNTAWGTSSEATSGQNNAWGDTAGSTSAQSAWTGNPAGSTTGQPANSAVTADAPHPVIVSGPSGTGMPSNTTPRPAVMGMTSTSTGPGSMSTSGGMGGDWQPTQPVIKSSSPLPPLPELADDPFIQVGTRSTRVKGITTVTPTPTPTATPTPTPSPTQSTDPDCEDELDSHPLPQ